MKLRLLLFSLVLIGAATVNGAAQKKEFVGYEHQGVVYGATLPNGAKDLGGGLLSDENYGVSRFSKGKKFMLWFERITERGADGVPSWEVKDVLTFSRPKKNREFLLSHSSDCLQNGKENLDLIVLGEFLAKTKTYKVINAWQANIDKEKFEKVSTIGIVCKFEEPQNPVED